MSIIHMTPLISQMTPMQCTCETFVLKYHALIFNKDFLLGFLSVKVAITCMLYLFIYSNNNQYNQSSQSYTVSVIVVVIYFVITHQ